MTPLFSLAWNRRNSSYRSKRKKCTKVQLVELNVKNNLYFRKIYKERWLVKFWFGEGGIEGTMHKKDYSKFEKQVLIN